MGADIISRTKSYNVSFISFDDAIIDICNDKTKYFMKNIILDYGNVIFNIDFQKFKNL